MKAVAVTVFALLVNPNISTSYRVYVKRSAEPSVAGGNDPSNSMAPSGNSLGIPEDDPDLQDSLQKVMRQMDQKLNRTPYDANVQDGTKTTQRLKLFFVSPSPEDPRTRESLEETLNQGSPDTGGVDVENSAADQFENFANEETKTQKPPISYNFPDFPALSSSPEQDIQEQENFRGNNAGTLLQNNSHSAANDKVEMKVELTINLSENDQHQHFHYGNLSGDTDKNISLHPGHTHGTTRGEETETTMLKTNHNPQESDSVVNIAAGNMNLNIKVMPHNHTTEHGDSKNSTEKTKQLEKQGGSRSLNVLGNKKDLEAADEVMKDSLNKPHKAKKDVNNSDYTIMNNPKQKSPETIRKVKATERGSQMDDLGQSTPEAPSSEKTSHSPMETQTPAKDPPTTESSPPQSHGNNTDMHDKTLSDSLKAIIQNLTKYYANQNGDHSQDGENLIRNISKFLPGQGGTPEEQNYLQQLRQYLSQPNLLSQIDLPNVETLTDFETFLKVLKKLSRSKIVRDSGYYPIISEYLNFYDFLNPGSKEDNSSEEESWSYESSLVDSLLDYLFEDDTHESGSKSGGKNKLKSHRRESDDSPESDEWDLM